MTIALPLRLCDGYVVRTVYAASARHVVHVPRRLPVGRIVRVISIFNSPLINTARLGGGIADDTVFFVEKRVRDIELHGVLPEYLIFLKTQHISPPAIRVSEYRFATFANGSGCRGKALLQFCNYAKRNPKSLHSDPLAIRHGHVPCRTCVESSKSEFQAIRHTRSVQIANRSELFIDSLNLYFGSRVDLRDAQSINARSVPTFLVNIVKLDFNSPP